MPTAFLLPILLSFPRFSTRNRQEGEQRKFDLDIWDERCSKQIGVPILCTVTSLQQRHMTPWQQVVETVRLEPRHKALAVKRSLRCKQCEHTLSKADFNPSFIKFRINLSALFHLPDLRFALPPIALAPAAIAANTPPRITPLPLPTISFDSVLPTTALSLRGVPGDGPTNFILVVANPAHHAITVRLRQLTPAEETERLAVYLARNWPTGAIYSTVKVLIFAIPRIE